MTTNNLLSLLRENLAKVLAILSLFLTFYGGWQLKFYLQKYGVGFPIELNLFPFVLPLTGLISLLFIAVLTGGIFSAPLFAATVFGNESGKLIPSIKKFSDKIDHKAILGYVLKIYMTPTIIWAVYIFSYVLAFDEYPISYAFALLTFTLTIYSIYISGKHKVSKHTLSRTKITGTYFAIGLISSWSAMISTLLVVKMYPEISDLQLFFGLSILVLLNAMCFLPKHVPIKTIFVGREVEDLIQAKPTLIWMIMAIVVVFAISTTPRACEFIGQASLRALGIGGGIEKRIIVEKQIKSYFPEIFYGNEQGTDSQSKASAPLNLILNSGSHSYFELNGNVYKIKNDNFIEITRMPK